MRRLTTLVLACTCLLVLAGGAYAWLGRESTITIVVDGVDRSVRAGTTLGHAVERFGLEPRAGDLLDVRGAVLATGAFPGRILLNGRRAAPTTRLSPGDRLRVVPGESRREETSRVFLRVPGGVPANPQHSLGRAPGIEFEKGVSSRKPDPATVRPSGSWRQPRAVALTFDDGPSPYTSRILALLRRLQAPATFFVVGSSAERYPKLVKRQLRLGMAVENHSYSHPYRPAFDKHARSEIDREIRRTKRIIRSLGGSPRLFRPPGGHASGAVVSVARTHGDRVLLWSVDAEDWRPGATASQIATRVLRDVHPGSIVLLHDGGGNRTATVRALPRIVKGIRAMGLELVLIAP